MMGMLCLGGVFALAGAPMVWLAWRTFGRDRAIAAWPKVAGRILGSHVQRTASTYRDQDGYDRKYTACEPKVRYTYTVGTDVLQGDGIARSIEGTSMGEAMAQRIVDAYPAGRDVMVLYDPSRPQTAYLEVRRSIGAIILMGFGGVLMGIGGLLMVLSLL